jgi:muramidase (phage lysozyme)/soluble cytochrome b562
MNKELLAKLYAKYNLQSVGSIDEFISDMRNPSIQEKFFNNYGLNKIGTIDEFRKDLGYTNPTAEKYNFEYNPDDPKSMVKSAFLNTISSLEGASPDTIVGGTKTNDLSKHPNKIGFTYADGRVSTAAGSYQITGQTWNDINKTLNLPDFSENSQKIAATYLAETRYKQQTNGDLWEDLLSAKNDPKKLTEIKNKLGSTWTPLAGKDDEFLKNYLGYNGIDNLFKKQNSALIDDNNKNIINTANIDRVTTLRNIYLESEKEARSTKEVAPRFSKNDALINAEDYVGKIDHKKAKEIFYSKIDPTQYTEEEIFDAMNPGVRSGILEKGRIVDQKNKEEESEKGILNTIGERVAAIFLDDPEVVDGKYNIADRTISETMNPAESIKNDLSFTRDQLLAKDQNGKYTLDNSIDSLNLSQNEKLKLKDKSKRIRQRLLSKENAEYNVKTSALGVGMDVVNYHLKTVKENMKQELGDEKMAIIESVSKNPNATQEDIQAFQEIVSASKYKDEYIKLLDKASEFGNKFNSLPPVYKESLFLKKQSEKLQTEYDQYLADRGTKFQIFNSLSRFSNDLVPSIASSTVESGAAIVGTAIEATTGADLNATKYLIDQSANTRSIRSSKENLGGLYQAAEFTDQLGNKYKTTFDEDGNVQDIYYENGVKHYTEDRFTDTLYTLAENLNKKKELYQNRDNYNFSGLGMLDQGLESAKDIAGMMIPFGGALGITAKGAKLAKNASALSKGLNALKKVATSERAREFGSSMMMFADNFAEEAINEGIVDPAGIFSYTAAKTTLESLTEMVFPFATKMSDDLGRVLNRTPSGTNTNAGNIVSNYLQKRFGNNWVKVLADGVPPGLLTDFTKTLKNIGADAISEGAEELMVEAANPFVNAALNNSGLSSVHLDEDWGNATEWGNSFLVGAFMGGVLGTGRTGLKGISQGKDLFNKEARYYNYVKEGLKSTLANKEVTDHFINSLEGKKPKEEIDRLRKIIDNTRKDASYILENESPNSSLADNLLTTAFELNMQREGRSFGKLPQTIKEEEKTTFLERKLSELNKNVALGSRTEINIADILSHPSTTITGEKDGKVSKVDIKRAYRDLSEADINKLIEETHDKVFSESNVKKQSNLFLQKEYAKELLSGFNKLVKQENKLNEEDNSFSVEEIENPIDRKEDAEDVKAKKVENTKLNTDELKQEKIRLNQELSGYTTSEEYNAAYNSESDPVLKSFIREHQEVRANTQKKGIELEDGSNKLTKAEQLNNDNLPRRYGASKLFEAKETREVGNNLKKVIESNPNYKSELDKLKKNASYQTNVPELKGLFNYINGIYMLESDQDPSITPDTFDTDKAINEYYSSISNFNNDTNLQSAIDNYNKNTEVQEEKPVEVISDLEKQQIVTYTNLQKKIKQGGPWRYDTIIANIEKAYNDNVLTKDQHDVLVNLANEKNNRLKGKGNKSEVSKQEPVKSKSDVNNIESKRDDIERRRPTSYIRDSKDKKSPLETFRNEAKREWDGVSVITGDRMKNLYVGIQLFVEAYPEHKDLLDKFIKKENGTIGITNNNLSFVLNTLKKQGVTTENELGNKINAKYDAELKELESKTTASSSKVVQTPSDIETQKDEIERRRQEALDKYSHAITVKSVTYKFVDDFEGGDNTTHEVKVETKADGSVHVITYFEGEVVNREIVRNKDRIADVKGLIGAKSSVSVRQEDGTYSKYEIKESTITEETENTVPENKKVKEINTKYDAEIKALEQSNSQIDVDSSTEETKVETPVTFDVPVVQTMNFFRSTVGKPGGETSIIVKYTREDGSFGITTIPIDTWKKMRSSNLDKFEIKDENGNILTGKVTYQEWINERVVKIRPTINETQITPSITINEHNISITHTESGYITINDGHRVIIASNADLKNIQPEYFGKYFAVKISDEIILQNINNKDSELKKIRADYNYYVVYTPTVDRGGRMAVAQISIRLPKTLIITESQLDDIKIGLTPYISKYISKNERGEPIFKYTKLDINEPINIVNEILAKKENTGKNAILENKNNKKNIEDELRKTNIAQTILKEDDTVYYEVNFENYNGTDSALPKRKFEIVVVAYYKDGKIVKADTVGATRAIVGTLINNPDTPEGDALSEKDPVRNLLYPYYLNKEVKQIPVKVAGKNNRISYHKGEWRSLEPTEIEKYEFDVVIQPFQGSNIGLAQDAKENSDEFKKSDTNIPLGENSVGKVIAKIPSGVPGEFIGVELNTPMLKDFPNGQDTIRNTLNKILTLANTGNIKDAEKLMRTEWVYTILNTLAYRTPFSTFDAMRQYKGETQQNPRGGKGPIILFPIKSAGKTYYTFVVKTKTGEPLDLSIDEILDFLGDTRVHVPNNQDGLKKFINENPTALKTDLVLPVETDNTTFPVVFNNSTITLQPLEPNVETSNIKEDTTPVRRSFKEGEKARFKISENTEEYTSTSAESYIRKRFEEVGVAVSDVSLNILRKIYEVGDRKIWGAFHKAIVYLSSEAGELTGKHEGWHVLFGLFTTPEHKIRLYKEAFKKYGNELGISKEEFENALSQFTTNKDTLFSTENDFYSTLDILDRIEEAMARDAETFKVTGILSEEFKDKYPTIYKLFNDILNFIYDSYLRLQPYIPYLANRSNLNSLYYQMDKNYFGRGFNGKRLSRYKNIFRINYNNLYSQNEPRFSVEGLSTKEAKEYAEFVIDKLLRNIIQDKFDGYRSLTRSLKDAEDATKMLNESWQYIDEYARYYVEDNEIKNVDKELQTLSRIKNDPDFKLLALSRLNQITGYAADLEGIIEDSNTENENEDNNVEESSEKIIIRNSNVDVTKKISGKLREMLTLLHKKDKNGDFVLSGPFSTYSTYDYTEVYKRLYQYLTDIPDNKLMWKTLIKHSSTYPYFREIAEYIFDQLVSRNSIPGYEGQSLNDYISDENLSSILEDNIYKSELFSLMFKRFGDQTSHQYIQTIVKSDGSVNLMYVNKENIDDNIRDEMDSHFSANPQLFPEVITQNDLSDLYGKFGLLVTDDELANLTKKEIELLIEDFTKLGVKVKELISKGEIPAKSVLRNSGITYIMKSYNKLKPNLTNNVTRTIKNDLQFNIGYSNYISRLMSKTKSNAAYYRDRMKKDIFAKYLPAWRDMLVNTKNLDGIGWEILTDTGSKLTPGEMGKEYHELTKRELKILNINNFNAIGYQTSRDVVVANPIYSDATVHTYMKVPRIDTYSIIKKLALTALAELSRIEYHSKNKSDSEYWNKNGGNFLLLGFLNGEIEIEVTENGNKQKQKVNGKEYFLNKYRSLLEDGNLPEARVQDMVSSLSLPIEVMMENEFNKYLTSLVELGIISPERTLIKGVLSSQVGKEGDSPLSLMYYFYNQVYYNTQFIGVIGGDPAYYKPNSSPRKSGDTLENYLQIDIDHLKRMKAWHSPNSRGVYIDEFGKEKKTKKVLYLKDVEVSSSPEYAELMKHHGIKDSDKHSLTDAQGYNNPLFHLMVLQANAKITPEERTELQKRFININQKEDGSLSKTWKKGTFKKKDDKKNGIKSVMDIIKPFYAGHVEMILDENGNTSNVPFTEKSSEKGILIDEAYRLKDKEGNPTTISVPEGNPSKEYFNKYLNPTLAKILWVMQQGDIDSIAFDTTLKIYNPTAKTMSIDDFMNSSVDDILKNTLELPLEGYGDQQEIPVEKHKAKNTHEGSQTAAIFMGRGNAEQKEALNEIIKHAVDDKIKKWKEETATIADIGKKLRTNAVKQNKDSHTIDGYSLHPDGNLVAPLAYPSMRKINEAALNALAKGNIHEEIKGGSLINTSAIGMSDKLKIVKGENGTIKHVECAMAPHHPLIIALVNEYGVVTPEMVIEAYGKEVADGLLNFMAYRIPTEGAYSIYKLKVKYFLPDGSGAQIMLPAEATSVTGLDFDIDKMYALYKTVTSNFDIEELRGVYQTYLDANEIDTEIDNDVARQIYNLVLNNNDIETTGDKAIDYLIQLLYNYTRSNFDQFKELVKSHELVKPGLDTKEARNNKKLAIYDEIMQTESWAKEFLQGGSAELLKETIAEVDKIYPNTSNRVYEIATPTHQEENAEKATEGGRSIGAFANAVKHHNYTSDTEIKLLRPITIFDTSYNGIGESLWETINVSGWYVAKVLSSLLFASTENIKNPLLSAMGLKDTNRDTVIAAIRLGIPLNQVITLLRHPVVENIFNSSKDPINDIRALYTNLLDKYELKEAPPSVSFDEYKKLISEKLDNKDSDMLLLSILDNIITLSDIGDELFTIQSISKFDTEDSFKPDLNLTFNKLLKIADRRNTSEKYLSGNSYFGNPFFDDQDVLNILPNVSYNDAEGVFEFERKDIPGGVNSLNEYARVAVEEINHYKDNIPHFGPAFKAIRSDIQEQLASKRLSNKQIEIINNAIYAFIGQTELSDKLSILPNFGQIFAKVKSSEFAKKYPFTFAYLNTKFINGVSFVSKSGRPFDSEIMVKIKDEMSAMINDNTKLGLEDNPNYNGIEFAENLLFYGFVKSKFSFNFEGFAEIAPIDMLQNPDPNNIGNRIREVFKMDKDKVSSIIANIPNFSTKILVKHPELARHVGKEDFTAPETQILYHGMPIDPVIQIKQDDNIINKYKTSDENEPFLPYIRNTYYSSNESERRVPNLRVLYKHESNGKYVAVINKTDPRVYTIYEGGFRLHESIKDTNITKPVVNSITPSNTPESNINETLRADNNQNVNTEVNGSRVEVSKVNYTKQTPNDKSKGFFFTENLQAYLANRGRGIEVRFDLAPKDVKLDVTATNNQAGIRRTNGQRNLNSFAIISKKFQQNGSGSFVKEEGQFKDTNEDFELFKKYNSEAINEAIAYNKPLVAAEAGIATGKSALPLRFAEWLNNELSIKLGIQGNIKENTSTGYKGYGIFNLQNVSNQSIGNATNNQNTQVQDSANNKKLFNPNDKSLKKGSIVDYNGSMYLFWNENSSGKAQLIKTDGTKASATPNIDKLKVIGSYPIVQYNNNEYIVTDNNNIYSGSTGNLVYNGNDNSSKIQKERIINSVRNNNVSEGIIDEVNDRNSGVENIVENIDEYIHDFKYDINVGTGYDDTVTDKVKIISKKEGAIKRYKSGKYTMDLDLYTVENKKGKQFTFYLKPTGAIIDPKFPGRYTREFFTENTNESASNFSKPPIVDEQKSNLSSNVKPLFTLEKAKEKLTFRNKSLEFVDKIPTSKDYIIGASNRDGKILLNENALLEKYKNKSWSKNIPALEDGSKITPLPESQFNSFNEYFTFVLLHELAHDLIKINTNEKRGDYENRINRAALRELVNNYDISPSSKNISTDFNLDINKELNKKKDSECSNDKMYNIDEIL